MDAVKNLFHGIGYGANGKYQFDEDTQINYLPDAFGLSLFTFAGIAQIKHSISAKTQGETPYYPAKTQMGSQAEMGCRAYPTAGHRHLERAEPRCY
ncbi:MAG: hypothetical protein U5L09_09290 [Bacteroidales bacterium]|nr:hypothetical protein [Bacteroidales bacterium]